MLPPDQRASDVDLGILQSRQGMEGTVSNDDLISSPKPPRVTSCDPVPGFSPRIGRYVAQLAETRQELLSQTADLTPDQLSWYPNDQVESIGTQLLHVAAIEWSYVLEDIFGRPGEEYDGWEEALPLRLGLPQVRDRPLAYFTDRLDRVREDALAALRGLTDDDLSRLVPVAPTEPVTWVYTVDWALFHLVQHEAHHAGQVELLVRLLPPSLAS
jgi:uncharacterized damage-inducible protein DinB